MLPVFIKPEWPAPARVKALTTSRIGGVSQTDFSSLNIATHVGDKVCAVDANRKIVCNSLNLPAKPQWLEQVHGKELVYLDGIDTSRIIKADAAFTHNTGVVCTVMTADCLPVLLCKQDGTAVAAIHAGWRGLLAGIIEKTVAKITEPEILLAWLGPAIGPGRFEVGVEVKDAFVDKSVVMQQAFRQIAPQHYLADLYALARMVLIQQGVKMIYGGEHCTYNEKDKFYSYRRQPKTGRMASLIWLE